MACRRPKAKDVVVVGVAVAECLLVTGCGIVGFPRAHVRGTVMARDAIHYFTYIDCR